MNKLNKINGDEWAVLNLCRGRFNNSVPRAQVIFIDCALRENPYSTYDQKWVTPFPHVWIMISLLLHNLRPHISSVKKSVRSHYSFWSIWHSSHDMTLTLPESKIVGPYSPSTVLSLPINRTHLMAPPKWKHQASQSQIKTCVTI